MNILLSCIGKRGYIADYFRETMPSASMVIGTSNSLWTPGFASCDKSVVLSPISSVEYIPELIEACSFHNIGAVLSLYDPDVHKLAENRHLFTDAGICPIFPALAATTIAYDKLETFRFLTAAGIPTPLTTESLSQAEDWLSNGSFRFPLIVKPRFGFGSLNTFLARNLDEVRVFYNYVPSMLVQEYIEGKAYNVDGLGDLECRPLSVVPWQKLLSKMGETERAVTVDHPALSDLAAELIQMVGIVGPFDADFFETADGRLLVLELNLRFGGGYPVSHLAGADFPAHILAMMGGKHSKPTLGIYKRGVTMMKKLQVIHGPTPGKL